MLTFTLMRVAVLFFVAHQIDSRVIPALNQIGETLAAVTGAMAR